nr:hypothetical protein [Methanofollis tationis]
MEGVIGLQAHILSLLAVKGAGGRDVVVVHPGGEVPGVHEILLAPGPVSLRVTDGEDVWAQQEEIQDCRTEEEKTHRRHREEPERLFAAGDQEVV